MHIGDVDRRGDDLSGVGVHLAARVLALAGAGEILVTAAVPLAVTGSACEFQSRGLHQLKGVAGEWELFEYVHGDAP